MLNGKTLPVLALTLASSAALGDWQMIGSNGKEFSLFADIDSARRSGNVVSVAQMVTYGDSQPGRITGRRYLSERSQIEFDCAAKRARTLTIEQYAGNRASGTLVYRETNDGAHWAPVPEGTNLEVTWRRSCDR